MANRRLRHAREIELVSQQSKGLVQLSALGFCVFVLPVRELDAVFQGESAHELAAMELHNALEQTTADSATRFSRTATPMFLDTPTKLVGGTDVHERTTFIGSADRVP